MIKYSEKLKDPRWQVDMDPKQIRPDIQKSYHKIIRLQISHTLEEYLKLLESNIKDKYDAELSKQIDCVLFLLETL